MLRKLEIEFDNKGQVSMPIEDNRIPQYSNNVQLIVAKIPKDIMGSVRLSVENAEGGDLLVAIAKLIDTDIDYNYWQVPIYNIYTQTREQLNCAFQILDDNDNEIWASESFNLEIVKGAKGVNYTIEDPSVINVLDAKINDNAEDIQEIKDNLVSGVTPVGNLGNVDAIPTSEELTNFTKQQLGREPKNGDYVKYTLVIPNKTDENYTVFFGKTAWGIPIKDSPIEKADNRTYGTIIGNYNTLSGKKLQINIFNGEIVDILTEDNNGKLISIVSRFNSSDLIIENVPKLLNGVIPAKKAEQDANGDIIATTYAKADKTYTKAESDDRYLSKNLGEIFYLTSNGYTEDAPNPGGIIARIDVSNKTALSLTIVLEGDYSFSNKSRYSFNVWFDNLTNNALEFKLTTSCEKQNGDTFILDETAYNVSDAKAGVLSNIVISTNFTSLTNSIDLDPKDKFKQVLEVTNAVGSGELVFYNTALNTSTFSLENETIISEIRYVNEPKLFSVPSSSFTFDADSDLYLAKIPYSAHKVAGGNKLNVNISTPLDATTKIINLQATTTLNNTGDIAIYLQNPTNLVLSIYSGVGSISKPKLITPSSLLINSTAKYNVNTNTLITNDTITVEDEVLMVILDYTIVSRDNVESQTRATYVRTQENGFVCIASSYKYPELVKDGTSDTYNLNWN